jgi:uncharacterized membrane protein YjjP (DUF1212 family)
MAEPWEEPMKNIGIIAILAGIVVIILALAGVVGQGGSGRTVIVGAIVLLVAGYLLYKRGQRPA